MFATVHDTVTQFLATPPNPGGGSPPPGADKFLKLLSWVVWMIVLACVGGIAYSGGKLAWEHRQGHGGGEGAKGLLMTLVGCVIVGTASSIVAALI